MLQLNLEDGSCWFPKQDSFNDCYIICLFLPIKFCAIIAISSLAFEIPWKTRRKIFRFCVRERKFLTTEQLQWTLYILYKQSTTITMRLAFYLLHLPSEFHFLWQIQFPPLLTACMHVQVWVVHKCIIQVGKGTWISVATCIYMQMHEFKNIYTTFALTKLTYISPLPMVFLPIHYTKHRKKDYLFNQEIVRWIMSLKTV